ncbi:MAG: heavy-metal-associated domain-containing protein [Chloroflexi bacterium]|nr:heavy-metal-associated domain-containing protein [Chloroflexota bacterium]
MAPQGAPTLLRDVPGSNPADVVSWFLPGLLERPAVGTSCCATTAEALIASELSLVPGIVDIAIDTTTGWISVRIDPEATTATDVADALSDVGYGPDRSVLPDDVAASR